MVRAAGQWPEQLIEIKLDTERVTLNEFIAWKDCQFSSYLFRLLIRKWILMLMDWYISGFIARRLGERYSRKMGNLPSSECSWPEPVSRRASTPRSRNWSRWFRRRPMCRSRCLAGQNWKLRERKTQQHHDRQSTISIPELDGYWQNEVKLCKKNKQINKIYCPPSN